MRAAVRAQMEKFADNLHFGWMSHNSDRQSVTQIIRDLRGETHTPPAPKQQVSEQEVEDNWKKMAKAFKRMK